MEFAHRTFLHALRDTAREMREQAIPGIERLQRAVREADDEKRGFARRTLALGRWHREARARQQYGPINLRVQTAQQIRMRVTALGEQLQHGFVIQSRLLGLAQPSGGEGQRPRQIDGFDAPVRERGRIRNQPGARVGVQFARHRQTFAKLEGANRRSGLRAGHPVDGTGRKTQTVQHNLRVQQAGHFGRRRIRTNDCVRWDQSARNVCGGNRLWRGDD